MRPPFQTSGHAVQSHASAAQPFGMQPGSKECFLWEENMCKQWQLESMRLDERIARQQHILNVLDGTEPPTGFHFDQYGNVVKDFMPGEDSYTG